MRFASLVGEPKSYDFPLIAEEQVRRRPFGGKELLHESQRVCRHLLAVISLLTSLEIRVSEFCRDNRVSCSRVLKAGKYTPCVLCSRAITSLLPASAVTVVIAQAIASESACVGSSNISA
jgi:hypothetical protein